MTIYRRTRQRQVILEEITKLGNHPTADIIYEAVRKILPKISLSTVYRNLGILVNTEEILAVRIPGQEVHYDHNTHDHCHIRCLVCNNVHDIYLKPFDIRKISSENASGYKICEAHTSFTGICPDCQKTIKKKGK